MKSLLSAYLLLSIACPSFAQSDSSYSSIYHLYMSSIGGASNLYNGTEYTATYPQAKGTPFLDAAGFQTGTLSYQGVAYKDVPIAYDLVTNEIVIKGFKGRATKLDANKIDFFIVPGHHFVRLKPNEQNENQLPEDFYEVLFDGNVKVYVKRKKQVERSFSAEEPYKFSMYNAYFVYNKGMFKQVSNKNALIDVFKDKVDDVRSFIKENKFDFRNDLEQAIVKTAGYYVKVKE